VRRLVLASTTAGVFALPGSPLAFVHMMSPLRYRSRSYLLHAVPAISGGRIARDPELLVRHAADRLAAPPTFWGYGSQVYAMSWWTSAHWLHRITRPTLVLAGDDDPLVPLANARFLARRIPAARLHVVSGGGHLLLVDQPEDVARILTPFLEDPVETT
jgi:pimeloyl-ACP methyl ester carboxylesterase